MRTGRSLTRYRRSDARWDDLITLTAVCPYEGDLSGHIMKLVPCLSSRSLPVTSRDLT